jgi:hypothetical protein
LNITFSGSISLRWLAILPAGCFKFTRNITRMSCPTKRIFNLGRRSVIVNCDWKFLLTIIAKRTVYKILAGVHLAEYDSHKVLTTNWGAGEILNDWA